MMERIDGCNTKRRVEGKKVKQIAPSL